MYANHVSLFCKFSRHEVYMRRLIFMPQLSMALFGILVDLTAP